MDPQIFMKKPVFMKYEGSSLSNKIPPTVSIQIHINIVHNQPFYYLKK
jgi:hypothetical protein